MTGWMEVDKKEKRREETEGWIGLESWMVEWTDIDKKRCKQMKWINGWNMQNQMNGWRNDGMYGWTDGGRRKGMDGWR